MKIILLLACLAIGFAGFSQTKKDTIATVIGYAFSVYAGDTSSFSDKENAQFAEFSKNPTDLQAILQRLEGMGGSQMPKVAGIVKGWIAKANQANGTSDYKKLVSEIEKKLLNSGTDANWREENVAQLFTAQANKYLATPSDIVEQTDPPAAVGPSDESISDKISSSNMPGDSNSTMPNIALALGGLSFLGVIVLLLYINNLQKKAEKNRRDINQRINTISTDFNSSKSGSETTALGSSEKVKALEQRLQATERSLAEITNKMRSAKEPGISAQKKPEQVVAASAVSQPVREITTLYAQMPDMENGFSATVLSNRQSGEEAYEIEVNANNATFIISNDPKAQRYALSDFKFFLEKGCELLNDPTPNCRIYTREAGTLVKNGNNWVIQNKAKVEFA